MLQSLFDIMKTYIDQSNILKLKKLKLSVYLRLSRQKGYWKNILKVCQF